MTEADRAVVDLRGVSVIRSRNLLLDGVDWRIGRRDGARMYHFPHQYVQRGFP